jgi:acyl-CoA thioesterase
MLDRAADLALFGLDVGADGASSFELTRALSRLDGRLYGGTALGVAIVLGEVATGRPALWTTVQFVSGKSAVGDRIECHTEVLAHGRQASQVRVRAYAGGNEIFCSVGATADHKPEGLEGTFQTMPTVLPPDACALFSFPKTLIPEHMRARMAESMRIQEIRIAEPTGGHVAPPGEVLFWTKAVGCTISPAVLGYLADLVPMSVAKAARRAGGGTSIDNTVRFGSVPGGHEWVLAQLDPHLAAGGYGHGTVHLWSPDGQLLGTGSQTASMFAFD